MSDSVDDAQAPSTSGAKPKKKASKEEADKSKEQTSSDTKKDGKKKASILKSEKSTKDENSKKKSVKIDSPEPSTSRRQFSDQKSSRYRMATQQKRTQQSHSIANVVPRREAVKRQEPAVSTLSYTYEEPSADRDHHLALEFLERHSPYHARESLLDLRKRDQKEKIRQHHHHHRKPKEGLVKRHIHHAKRCRSCLEIESQCDCSKDPERVRLNSDWGFLVKPEVVPRRTFTAPRLDWLEELEEASEGLVDRAEEEFTKEHEICCFPFNTFNIFKKKERRTLDFYRKN